MCGESGKRESERVREISQFHFSRMQSVKDPKGNPFKGSTVFSRRITVVQGLLQFCHEFLSSDRGNLESRFWIASSY
jgi:hypothetical protein